MNQIDSARRPIAARQSAWAQRSARALVSMGLRPNAVSLMSVVFSAITCACLIMVPLHDGALRAALLLIAAAAIPVRAMCNLWDGLMAIEGGMKSKAGGIYNDLPDRFSDSLILVGVGYALGWSGYGPHLGWLAAGLAMLTAYVRVLGASCGAGHHFIGPMAKQQRMVVLGIGCVLAVFEPLLGWNNIALKAALIIIVAGCSLTIARRLHRIIRDLQEASA